MNGRRTETFDLKPGRVLAGRYTVESKLGSGWEGEVYRVVEQKTGIRRAAKLFFPQRNDHDRALRFYARKLDCLRRCSIVIQYHHSVSFRFRGMDVTCLISELVDGDILTNFLAQQRGRRLQAFEALHLSYALARGLEQIHRAHEYHGDLHADNVLLQRRGIGFDVKVVDFFYRGAPTRERQRDDIVDLVRLLYDAVGGRRYYHTQPACIKSICRGLRHDLILERFPTATRLRDYLETFTW